MVDGGSGADKGLAHEQAEVTVSSLRPGVPAEVRSRGRCWYRIVSGVVLVALALAGTFAWLRPTQPASASNGVQPARPSDPLAVDTSSMGIPFVDGAAWSPDSTRLLLVPQGPLPIIHVLGPKRLGS